MTALFGTFQTVFRCWKFRGLTICSWGSGVTLWEMKEELRRKLKDSVNGVYGNRQSCQAVSLGSCLEEEDREEKERNPGHLS